MKSRSCVIAILGVVLCFANAKLTAGEIFDERAIVKFDGRKWVAAHASASQALLLTEYVLEGETVDDWSELVTATFYPFTPSDETVAFTRDQYRKYILEDCETLVWEESFSSQDLSMVIWNNNSCIDTGKFEYTMTSFMNGQAGVHSVSYATHDSATFEERRQQWHELLSNVEVFVPDSSAQLQDYLVDHSKMIQTQYRYQYSASPDNSKLEATREFWRSGNSFFRSEEPRDTDGNLLQVIISSEPDVWMVDLTSNSAKHYLDPGPTFNTICPVFGPPRADGLSDLEFGKEEKFFNYYGARNIGAITTDGVDYTVFELPRLYWVLHLYINSETGRPYKISRRGQDGATSSIIYDKYTVNLQLDSTLFLPPTGLVITEG